MPSGLLISIIDDDDSFRSALIGLIRSLGYGARGFESAEEFVEFGVMRSSACVITDIQMPGMSGIDLQHFLTRSEMRRAGHHGHGAHGAWARAKGVGRRRDMPAAQAVPDGGAHRLLAEGSDGLIRTGEVSESPTCVSASPSVDVYALRKISSALHYDRRRVQRIIAAAAPATSFRDMWTLCLFRAHPSRRTS